MKVIFEVSGCGFFRHEDQLESLPAAGDTVQITDNDAVIQSVDGKMVETRSVYRVVVRQRLYDTATKTWTLLCCTAAEFERELSQVKSGCDEA